MWPGRKSPTDEFVGYLGGLTGPRTTARCALCAVFLSDEERPAVAPAEYQDDLSDRYMAPEVGQMFCAGDGLTPEGERQTILVPDEATRLYLGLLARYSPGDPPGWYGDNSGAHEVVVDILP